MKSRRGVSPRIEKERGGTRRLLSMTNLLDPGDRAAFVAALGHLFEHSPWVADETFDRRPFRDAAHLHAALCETLQRASPERQLALINAHPDLAGRLARLGQLTAASAQEQAGAGLDRLSADELAAFQKLNDDYRARFGFPFIICARLNAKDTIMAAMRERIKNSPAAEHAAALAEIEKIARLRLNDVLESYGRKT
jgi:2-oxo-4-hydroxy-4-carboxy-5-ureidoimidazoline decarboxylase